MRNDADRYEAYYAQKLWQLLPELYRAEDSPELNRNGPLRELVERIGAQAAIVRRSMDRLWEDQSIETCDDWVIAYMADLLATNLVPGLDARGQRRDVAKTIYYRRRKGTVPQLEELAADLTSWDVRVVEFFRRLGRTRHRLDPEVGGPGMGRALQVAQGLSGPLTRTAIGGTADLRSHDGARLAHTAFDEFFHTADVRRGQGHTGWHGIPRLGVFLWRLQSVPLESVTPVRDATCENQYTFDPTGRDIPLFAASARVYGDQSSSPAEHQLPAPISGPLLQTAFAELYAAKSALDATAVVDHSLGIYRLSPSGLHYELVEYDPENPQLTADPRQLEPDYLLLPERGRFLRREPESGEDFRVSYHTGFSSGIGAGGYDRRLPGKMTAPLAEPLLQVSGGGDALTLALGTDPLSGTVLLEDSLTYTSGFDVELQPASFTLRAENHRRPVLRRPPGLPSSAWTFTGSVGPKGQTSELRLDGLFFCGDDVVLAGTFDRVVLTTCTLDPGNQPEGASGPLLAADGKPLGPCRLRILGQVRELEVDRCILGPVRTEGTGTLERLTLVDSILQAPPGEQVLDLKTTDVRMKRCTLLGEARVHRFDADTSILHDVVTVEDNQHGCVRFSAWATGSTLPRKYESVELAPRQSLFASRAFGRPDYAQLLLTAPTTVSEGAEDGSEMGAFCREKYALKARALRIKFDEYMPIGLSPVWVYVT
ncbi:hypothetical protein F0U61_20380 [Archangium violaceum]|uniref:hypothetical protein n=1 Tax=Archangium violaceum TaxID=83451 RepID=UPI002B29B98B|nr:hypothetical protein F0U61_20380 [Archangium violaceum]